MGERGKVVKKEEPKLPKCFLVCPIGKEGTRTRSRSDYVKTFIVERALEGLYEVVRADQMRTYGRIDDQIIRSVLGSDLIIVDFTDNNPNVYFEFGMRFTLADKPFLCICNKDQIDKLPFDVQQLNVIGLPMNIEDYNGDTNQFRHDEISARATLRDFAETLLDNPDEFVSPVADQAFVTLSQIAESSKNADTVRIILDKLSRLENTLKIRDMQPFPVSRTREPRPRSSEGFLQEARRLYQDRKYDEAIKILEPLVQLEPNNVPALYILGNSYIGAERYNDAEATFKETLTINPDFIEAKTAIEMIKGRTSGNE